jgi:hypothetical protein
LEPRPFTPQLIIFWLLAVFGPDQEVPSYCNRAPTRRSSSGSKKRESTLPPNRSFTCSSPQLMPWPVTWITPPPNLPKPGGSEVGVLFQALQS